MSELIIKEPQEMDSLEISKLTGKEHKNVIVDIKKMFSELEIHSGFFSREYLAGNGQKYTKYNLSKRLTLILVSGYSAKLRMAIIDRWAELENIENTPKTFEEVMQNALLLADTKVKQLETKILEDKPKVEFANAIGNSEEAILIRDYCKIINGKGITIGQNNLYKWLKENRYLMSDRKPYQAFAGYFKVVEKKIETIKGDKLAFTTYINGKGQEYFYKKLKESLVI